MIHETMDFFQALFIYLSINSCLQVLDVAQTKPATFFMILKKMVVEIIEEPYD